MFAIAFLIGLYANCILLIGLANFYTRPLLLAFTAIYILLGIYFWKRFDEPINIEKIKQSIVYHANSSPLGVIFLIMCFGIVLLGALGPETTFDAVWYHLTLPKIYLAEGGIRYIPGELLYYSPMPKLVEMLYVSALSIQGELLAKLIHMAFAVLTGLALYCVARRFVEKKYALLAVVVFFSNIVVLWEATTALVDIARAFFEIMAFWGLLEYLKTNKQKWLIESALLLGLAVETKLLAVGTLAIFVILLAVYTNKVSIITRLKEIGLYCILTLLVSVAWLTFSYVHTGNPIYPLFSGYQLHLGQDTLVIPGLFTDILSIFVNAADPISPLYLILLPIGIALRKKIPQQSRIVFVTSLLGLVVWSITPRTGGGRFLLAYLPLFSIAAAILIELLKPYQRYFRVVMGSIVLLAAVALGYRGIATVKYLPVVFGAESKQEYLTTHLNFSFGDFLDTDGGFAKAIKPNGTVLLYGFHNLYYMNEKYIDASWVEPGDTFEYIATQHTDLPKRFGYWRPIYSNDVTGVKLYYQGLPWIY